MAAGDETKGERVTGVAPWDLEPGQYTYDGGNVWARLPNGAGPANLTTWSPVEHEDGTLTLDPSILDRGTGWHGYLERGVWREV